MAGIGTSAREFSAHLTKHAVFVSSGVVAGGGLLAVAAVHYRQRERIIRLEDKLVAAEALRQESLAAAEARMSSMFAHKLLDLGYHGDYNKYRAALFNSTSSGRKR